nr:MAG TPA: hypothetical protein [Caudoviricetes sp.]
MMAGRKQNGKNVILYFTNRQSMCVKMIVRKGSHSPIFIIL